MNSSFNTGHKDAIASTTGPRTIGLEKRNKYKRTYAKSVNQIEWRKLDILKKDIDKAYSITERSLARQSHRMEVLLRALQQRKQQALERADKIGGYSKGLKQHVDLVANKQSKQTSPATKPNIESVLPQSPSWPDASERSNTVIHNPKIRLGPLRRNKQFPSNIPCSGSPVMSRRTLPQVMPPGQTLPPVLHLQALSYQDHKRQPLGRWVRYPPGQDDME